MHDAPVDSTSHRGIMAFEHRKQPLLSRWHFAHRMARHIAFSLAFMAVSLFGGVLGYRLIEDMTWTDAFLNASMILGGMGPVAELKTEGGKVFAGCYALYSGLGAVIAAGYMAAPIFHRILHRFHMEAGS